MITAKGLELRLRKLEVWTKFRKNIKLYGSHINILVRESQSYEGLIRSSFSWYKTPEGYDSWDNIAVKIDEVKL